MNVDIIGVKVYSEAIREAGGAWLLLEGSAVFTVDEEEGKTLFTWASQSEANNFAKEMKSHKLNPVFFPFSSLFANLLGASEKEIVGVAASAKYGFPALTYSKKDYCAEFNT